MSVAQTVGLRIGGQWKGEGSHGLCWGIPPPSACWYWWQSQQSPDRIDGLQVMSQTRDLQNTREVRYLLLHDISPFLPHAITVKVSEEIKLVQNHRQVSWIACHWRWRDLPLEHTRYENSATQSHKCTTDLLLLLLLLLLFIINQKDYNL